MDQQAARQRAQLLIELKKYEEAKRQLRELLREYPHEIDLELTLAELCLLQGQTNEARQIVLGAIGNAPTYARAHYVLSSIELDAGYLHEAERAVREAIALQPDRARHFARLAQIEFSLTRFADATESATRALRIDPQNLLALNVHSRALARLGDSAASDAAAATALMVGPDNPHNHYNYGWTLLEGGRYDDALTHFRIAATRDPEMTRARDGMKRAIRHRFAGYRFLPRVVAKIRSSEMLKVFGPLAGIIGASSAPLWKSASWDEAYPVVVYTILGVAVFAGLVTSWRPLDDAVLLTHSDGRKLLDARERAVATRSVVILGMALTLMCLSLLLLEGRLLVWAGCAVLALLPVRYLVDPPETDKINWVAAGLQLFALAASFCLTFTTWTDLKLLAYLQLAIFTGLLIGHLHGTNR